MALSLDDKLLGEKVDNYCSSSEDEHEGDSGDEEGSNNQPSQTPTFVPEAKINDYTGNSTNTGPKGVINDWREFKRLETEKREGQEREKAALAKKLQLTCRYSLRTGSHLPELITIFILHGISLKVTQPC